LIEDAHLVIGDGVCAFWFVQCCSVDSNTRSLRTDFLVRRCDTHFPDVRLHPQTAKNKATSIAEALPVYGSWEDWRPGAGIGSYARVASEESCSLVRDLTSVCGYKNISRADLMGKVQAREFLRQEVLLWERLPHPRCAFKVNLTDGRKFPWHLYVTKSWWHAKFVGQPAISAFGYGWHEVRNAVVFWGISDDDRHFIVDLSMKDKKEFQWDETVSDK
jgi:hypothetical protein